MRKFGVRRSQLAGTRRKFSFGFHCPVIGRSLNLLSAAIDGLDHLTQGRKSKVCSCVLMRFHGPRCEWRLRLSVTRRTRAVDRRACYGRIKLRAKSDNRLYADPMMKRAARRDRSTDEISAARNSAKIPDELRQCLDRLSSRAPS